ncbi:MAG: pilus assembly protein PilM [Planctomycetota bacterium]|nr:pilus assembly protein PilM [Planctomycetota bacterium]
MAGKVLFGVDFSSSGLKIAQVRLLGRQAIIERLFKAEPGGDFVSALASSGMSVKGATAGLSGADVMVRYLRVQQLPPPRLKMVLEFEMGEMKEKSSEPLCADYVVTPAGDISGDMSAIVVLVKEQVAAQKIYDSQRLGISTHSLLPNSFALFNTFLSLKQYDPEGKYLLIDIGAENTSIAVVQSMRLVAARSISTGGSLFTQFLSDSLGIPFQQAEQVKKEEGVIKSRGWTSERQKKISDALSLGADRFSGTLSSTLSFLKRQLNWKELKFDKVLLFGGGAVLEGLKEHLAESMHTEVEVVSIVPPPEDKYADVDRRPALAERLPAEDLKNSTNTGSEFSVAVGLALSGAGEPFIKLSLVPEKIGRQILFRERTVYLIGAGVLLLLFCIFMVVSVKIERGSAYSKKEALEKRLNEATSELSEMERAKKEIDIQKDALKHLTVLPEVNRSLVTLLCDLRRKDVIPPEVTVSSLSYRTFTEKAEKKEESAQKPLVRLSGEVVGEGGTEMDAVRKFLGALSGLDYISSANIDASKTGEDRARGRYLFTIILQFKER